MRREHDGEPIRGLPERLPEGERILWQGAPDWKALSLGAMRLPWVAGYFAVLAGWRVVAGVSDGRAPLDIAAQGAMNLALGVVVCGLLAGYAWLSARTTVYTLTNRRVVIRHGVALSKALNLPFKAVESAALKLGAGGVGDIPMQLVPPNKLAWPLLWPHVRPWRFSRPEPMLRAIPDAAKVADQLAQAMRAAALEAGRSYGVEAAPVAAPTSVPVAQAA